MSEKSLTEHFKEFFSLQIADNKTLKQAVYEIRHAVYCEELEYEKLNPEGIEKDQFDAYSQHVLIKHLSSQNFAGCSRLVTPPPFDSSQILPFEDCCLASVDSKKYGILAADGREYIGEISRLAVHREFRRRPGESSNPHGVSLEQSQVHASPQEMRLFPFIAVSLYLASAAIALDSGLKYVVVMMEPRLARLMSRFGICFAQIGNVMDYHGQRAMFYIDKQMLFDKLKPDLRELFEFVSEEITNSQT